MGCQPSKEKNNTEFTQSETGEDFKLSYREFIRNDIGQVFEFYHFSKIISRSSTSLVRKVIHRVSKLQRVCKIVPIEKKSNIVAIKQVQNLKNMDHPNIVQIQEYFFDKTYLYIIMESIQGSKLSQFLLNHTNCSLDSLIRIFQQLLSALNYCHQKGLNHNLIHPDNILIIEKGKNYFLKLIDFSESSYIKSPKYKDVDFPKQYSLFKDPYSTHITNSKNDVWSCAVLFLLMISGEKHFKDFTIHKKAIIAEKVNTFDIQKQTQNNLIDLLNNMLNQDLQKRFSIQQCLNHEIFRQFKEQRPSSKHRKKEDNFLSRLMQFKVEDRLQSVFWMYASLNLLSSTQKCEYMTEFCNLDKNKDGKLDKQEIKQGLVNTFNFKQIEAQAYAKKIFQSIDKNNNQYLEYSQFVMATSLISKHISEEELEKIFKQIDFNQDGQITAQELGSLMGGFQGAGLLMGDRKKISLKDFKKIMLQIFQNSQHKTKKS